MEKHPEHHVSWLALAPLVSLLLAGPAAAHTLPLSFLRLVPDADYLHLEWTFNPFELTFFSELDTNKDGRVDEQEWEARQRQATERVLECLRLRVDGKPVTADIAAITPAFDSHHATLRAHYAVDARQRAVTIESSLATLTSGSHFTQVTFGREGGAQSAQLDMQSTSVTFEAMEKRQHFVPRPATPTHSEPGTRNSELIQQHFVPRAAAPTRPGGASSTGGLFLAIAPVLFLLIAAIRSARKTGRTRHIANNVRT